MNASAKQRSMRKNMLRNTRYSMEDMDFTRKPKEVDALTKAQNIKAASILLDKLYEQEVARNTPEVITGYTANKIGRYVDTTFTGRAPIDSTPPPDWPFSENEWVQATQVGPFGLIGKVTAYVLHEQERQYRKHEGLYEFGASALDPDQLERMRNNKEKQRKINTRNWRNRMKNATGIEAAEVAPMPYNFSAPYTSSSDTYADIELSSGPCAATAWDTVKDSTYENQLVDEMLNS